MKQAMNQQAVIEINFTFVLDIGVRIYLGEFENMNHRAFREMNIG